MDWLNIHRSTLASEAFLGSEPTHRATWLCLLAYCCDQENGGVILGADSWNDRKWQQVIRITKEEANDSCPLWCWSGSDLTVWAYPLDKEREVIRNRENGKTGGRPPKPKQNQVVMNGLTQREPSAPISAETEQERKEKGKEGERNLLAKKNEIDAEAIYQAYPKKVGRADAVKAIMKALRGVEFDALMEATKSYSEAVSRWTDEDKVYIPHPATWFNQRRWDDDRSTWTKDRGSKAKIPTFDEWISEANQLVKNRVKPSAEWPYAGAEAEFQKNQANGWRFIQDWKSACAAAHSRFMAIEDAAQNRRMR